MKTAIEKILAANSTERIVGGIAIAPATVSGRHETTTREVGIVSSWDLSQSETEEDGKCDTSLKDLGSSREGRGIVSHRQLSPHQHSPSVPVLPPKNPSLPASPCKICGSPVVWESIYGDGVRHCETCKPPPSEPLVGKRFTIVLVGDQHAWIPLDFALARAEERRERARRDPTALSPLARTWSKPDADGWCYATDIDGRERARHKSLLPTLERLHDESDRDYQTRVELHRRLRHPDLQRLDETESEFEERMIAMTHSAELAEQLTTPSI